MRTRTRAERTAIRPLQGFLFAGLLLCALPALAQDPTVTAAVPDTTEQATYDLVVTISGTNFGTDSVVDFYVTGTSDPGGITVKRVRRRNPKTLEATIDVAADAQTQNKFDIQVRTGGRTGKGTELFKVLVKRPGPDPEVTYVYGGKVWVANADGSNDVSIHRVKSAYLRHPRMAPDRRSVVFVEVPASSGPPKIRRITYRVDSQTVVPTGIQTLFEGTLAEWDVVLSPLRANGTHFAFLSGNGQATGVEIRELDAELCATLPCNLSESILLHRSTGSIRYPLGGYSANGMAFFFQESPELDAAPWYIRRLDLSDLSLGAVTIHGPQEYSLTLDVANLDYGGLDSRLLFDKYDAVRYETALFVLDTWSGAETPLGDGHAATWSRDDTEILFVGLGNFSNWTYGPVTKWNLLTGVLTPFEDWAADPDWAPPLP